MRHIALSIALCIAFAGSCLAQQSSTPSEKDLMTIRIEMSQDFMQAMASHDLSQAMNHYSTDVVYALLTPSQSVTVGREALAKRYAEMFAAGAVTNYSSKPTEAHLMSDGTAWTSGTNTFTVVAKDGSKRNFHGSWLDKMRRDPDGVWRVTFQANASAPNP
jgi:uncharacterized protein (TIGR02246 family)